MVGLPHRSQDGDDQDDWVRPVPGPPSARLDLSPKGTRYYVFAVTWTYAPSRLATTLTNLRFGLNKAGYDLCEFHAPPDPPPRRTLVLNAMQADPDWKYAAVVVEKPKVHPSIRDPQHFYPKFARMPLNLVLEFRIRPGTSQAMIYTGRMPVSGQPRAAIAGAKESLPGSPCPAHPLSHLSPPQRVKLLAPGHGLLLLGGAKKMGEGRPECLSGAERALGGPRIGHPQIRKRLALLGRTLNVDAAMIGAGIAQARRSHRQARPVHAFRGGVFSTGTSP